MPNNTETLQPNPDADADDNHSFENIDLASLGAMASAESTAYELYAKPLDPLEATPSMATAKSTTVRTPPHPSNDMRGDSYNQSDRD